MHKKYDLKGSTVDREASEKEKLKKEPTLKVLANGQNVQEQMTRLILQDNDFVKDGVKVTIGEEAKSKLMETLSADVQFLIK